MSSLCPTHRTYLTHLTCLIKWYLPIYPLNPRYINLLVVVIFFFFDILWLIIFDSGICFNFERLFVMYLLVSSEFYIKNIYIFYFFILIKFDKQVDLTDLFNKWFMLGLRNSNPFNKHVRLNGWCTIYPSNSRYLNLLVVVVYFLWHIVIDYLWYWICFNFKWLFVM